MNLMNFLRNLAFFFLSSNSFSWSHKSLWQILIKTRFKLNYELWEKLIFWGTMKQTRVLQLILGYLHLSASVLFSFIFLIKILSVVLSFPLRFSLPFSFPLLSSFPVTTLLPCFLFLKTARSRVAGRYLAWKLGLLLAAPESQWPWPRPVLCVQQPSSSGHRSSVGKGGFGARPDVMAHAYF